MSWCLHNNGYDSNQSDDDDGIFDVDTDDYNKKDVHSDDRNYEVVTTTAKRLLMKWR